MPESKEVTDAIRAIETRFRIETLLMKFGASEEAAKLIASNPDQAKRFTYDGVDLRAAGSDLPAADDPNVKAFYLSGPFKALFVAPADKANGDGDPQIDPALLASARAGNRTAYSVLARDTFNGDIKALDAALADKGNGDGKDAANGHERPANNSSNPFFKLRKPDGTIDKAVESQIGRMIGVMGHRKVADIAKAAKSPAAPLGLSITGMPLKP